MRFYHLPSTRIFFYLILFVAHFFRSVKIHFHLLPNDFLCNTFLMGEKYYCHLQRNYGRYFPDDTDRFFISRKRFNLLYFLHLSIFFLNNVLKILNAKEFLVSSYLSLMDLLIVFEWCYPVFEKINKYAKRIHLKVIYFMRKCQGGSFSISVYKRNSSTKEKK